MDDTYKQRIETALKGIEVSKKIDALGNKVVKTMALDIMGRKFPDRAWKRSDLTMKDARNVVYQACLIDGYEF